MNTTNWYSVRRETKTDLYGEKVSDLNAGGNLSIQGFLLYSGKNVSVKCILQDTTVNMLFLNNKEVVAF